MFVQFIKELPLQFMLVFAILIQIGHVSNRACKNLKLKSGGIIQI